MSILVKFGIWAVPLGVVLAFLPLLYQTEFESTDFDYVQETCNRTLGSYKLQCPNISSDLKELFKSHGVVVLRQVLPPELIEDLIGEVQCRFRPQGEIQVMGIVRKECVDGFRGAWIFSRWN